jgi:hypothetical protein
MSNDWESLGEKLAILGFFTLSRICYRIAETFGRWGIALENAYRQKVTP